MTTIKVSCPLSCPSTDQALRFMYEIEYIQAQVLELTPEGNPRTVAAKDLT